MLNRLHRRSHFAVRCLRPLSRSYSVFVFPGQGAQQIGMGKDLAAESSLAREVFEEIDEALRLRLSHTMWNGTDLELKATEVTQPALFAHGMAAFKTLQSQSSSSPVAVMGHSVGEYAAMVAAGGLDITSGARLLRLRGLLMRLATEAHGKPVAMQALLTSPPPPMKSDPSDPAASAPATAAEALGRHIDASLLQPARDACAAAIAAAGPGAVAGIAAVNGPSQVVLSGDEATVAAAAATLRTSKFARRAVPLAVSCPFHCSIMTPAAATLRAVLSALLGSVPTDDLEMSLGALMSLMGAGGGGEGDLWKEVSWLVDQLMDAAAAKATAAANATTAPTVVAASNAAAASTAHAEGSNLQQRLRLRCPIITNADAAVHYDAASAGAQLVAGITRPVLWYPCTVQALTLAAAAVRAAESSAAAAAEKTGLPFVAQDEQAALTGASSNGGSTAGPGDAAISFIEFGPGNTLTTLIKQIAASHPQLLEAAPSRAARAANAGTASSSADGTASGKPALKPLELRLASVSTPADVRAALSVLA